MNFRTTLVLGIIFVAAVVVFIVSRTGDPPPKDDPSKTASGDPKAGKLFTMKSDDVRRLVIRPESAGGKALELTHDGSGKWALVQPVSWPAESFSARGLVDTIVNLTARGTVKLEGDNRAATGLDKPRYTVELTDK